MAFSASVFGGNRIRTRPMLGGRRHRTKSHHSRIGRARSAMSLFGSRKRRKSHRRMRSGSGFFSDAWDKIKSVGSHVIPLALPILKDLAVKAVRSRLGLGKRRKSRRSRRGGIIGSFGYGRTRRSRRRVGSRRHRRSHRRRVGSRRHRRSHRRRVGSRRRRSHRRSRINGRGPFGGIAGSLLGSLLPF